MNPKADQSPSAPGPAGLERLGDLLGDVYASGDVSTSPGGNTGGAVSDASGARPRGGRAGQAGRQASSDQPVDHARQLAAIWQDVVGDEVAANSRPLRLKQGKLTVSASSTAWAQTLQFLADTIGTRLNEHLGGQVVRQVVFHHAGWEEGLRDAGPRRRDAAPRSRREQATASSGVAEQVASVLSQEQQEALASVEAMELEPELKEKITRAMRVAFVRDQQDSVR